MQFSYTNQVDERIAQNFAMDRKNYYAARGAVVLSKVFLEKDAQEGGAIDTLDDDWAERGQIQDMTIGDVNTSIKVIDQERLININRLSKRSNKDFDRIYTSLMRLVDLLGLDDLSEYEIAASIADYIDEDEEGDYEQNAKNGPLTTIEEMLQIPGITPTILYGFTREDGEVYRGLADFVGLWGIARININTASAEALMSISPEISEEDADNILYYRTEEEYFNTPMDLTNVPGMSDIFDRDKQLNQYLTTVSTYFEAKVTAERSNVKKEVRAILHRQGRKVTVLFWKEREI